MNFGIPIIEDINFLGSMPNWLLNIQKILCIYDFIGELKLFIKLI
jgi:hypothetical protein